MVDEMKGYSVLGFVIGFQNVSIFKYLHLLISAEKLPQNLCNIFQYICINKTSKNYHLGAAHFCKDLQLIQWKS